MEEPELVVAKEALVETLGAVLGLASDLLERFLDLFDVVLRKILHQGLRVHLVDLGHPPTDEERSEASPVASGADVNEKLRLDQVLPVEDEDDAADPKGLRGVAEPVLDRVAALLQKSFDVFRFDAGQHQLEELLRVRWRQARGKFLLQLRDVFGKQLRCSSLDGRRGQSRVIADFGLQFGFQLGRVVPGLIRQMLLPEVACSDFLQRRPLSAGDRRQEGDERNLLKGGTC